MDNMETIFEDFEVFKLSKFPPIALDIINLTKKTLSLQIPNSQTRGTNRCSQHCARGRSYPRYQYIDEINL